MQRRTLVPGSTGARSAWSLWPCTYCDQPGVVMRISVNGVQVKLCQVCTMLFEYDPEFLDLLEEKLDGLSEG
jgi:hypothetical protein